MGYDDERSDGIPLIATYPAAKGRALPAAPRGAKRTRTLESIHGAALKADKDTARTFWNDISRASGARSLDNGIGKLWLDGRVEARLKDSVPQVGAPQAWAQGYDGKGTKVAVLDTGIDAGHPDIKDRILDAKSFVPGEEVVDRNGHGTHVASTIAGSGAASQGANKGVAPGTGLIVGKVLGDEGFGADSGIIEAMEWASAGAEALFVVHDGDGRLLESYAPYGEETPIPVASAQRLAGERLIGTAKRGKKLTVAQHRFARYVYDLVDRHDGAIPDRSLEFAPAARSLAKVENTFYGHRDVLGAGYRYDIPDYGPGLGFEEYEKFPGTREEWVTPLPGASFWYENHSVLAADGSDTALEVRSGDMDYTAGRTYPTEWFAPIARPRLGTGYWGPFRSASNDVQFNLTPWTDSGAGHSGSMPMDEYDTTSTAFYQGDTLIKKVEGRAGYAWDLSPEKLPYRFVLDSTRDADTWKTSVRTRTEWNFVSGALDPDGPAQADIPLLQLDYAVDTDLAGDVKAGTWTEIGLSSGTQEWLKGAVKATKASLSVSYDDGNTWTALQLAKDEPGSWTARFKTPKKTGAFVSLKAHAEAADGLGVDQEIIRAFGLK
ncbi:S8 family serine peptidase [Streptomyces sp. MMS24-I29]|uniref:S8 family serine peptidase n=1 Tax=Streptomyces sp. MMS24-I29 TaxID=3351480 RepID=UPI003C7AE5DD